MVLLICKLQFPNGSYHNGVWRALWEMSPLLILLLIPLKNQRIRAPKNIKCINSLAPSLLSYVVFILDKKNFALFWHGSCVLINEKKITFLWIFLLRKMSISIEKKVFNIYIEFWRVLILHVNKMYLLDLIEVWTNF